MDFAELRRWRNTPVAPPRADNWTLYHDGRPDATRGVLDVYRGASLSERMNDYMDAMREPPIECADDEEVPPSAPAASLGRSPVAMAIPQFESSMWSRWVDNWKRALLLCCCRGDDVDSWNYEVAMKRNVRHEMMTTLHPVEGRSVREQVVADVEQLNAVEVHHIPRLVVEVVVALRCKLGMGAQDRSVPGNVSVVRAEAAKMLRDWNVRHKDAAAHLIEIERCFFEDDTHSRVSTWRARLAKESRFFKWVVGENGPVGFDY